MTSRFSILMPLLLLAACVAPKPPAPPPPVVAPPLPRPAPPQTSDWRDVPLSPGDWSYAPLVARFGRPGAPEFVIRCDPAARTVSLVRTAAAGAARATMAVKTSAGDRALAAAPVAGPPPGFAATLPARDGFLDRIAFSRGRFTVAVAGTPLLVIPAWPEVARVIEDCRG